MLWPLQETLNFIAPNLPAQVIPSQVIPRVAAIAGLLQDSMSSFYLECRLDAQASQVDFLSCATVKDGRAMLSGCHAAEKELSSHIAHPIWRSLQSFFVQWGDPASPLYEQVPLIWLEFDHVNSQQVAYFLPSLSICLDPAFLHTYPRLQHCNRIDRQTYQVLITMASKVFDDSDRVWSRQERLLLRCFDCLPQSGQLIHLSVMLARQPFVLKLYGAVPVADLTGYLACIGWAGSIVDLNGIVSEFSSCLGQDVFVDLTIGETVAPRIGIAFPHDQIAGLSNPERQRAVLLAKCVELGICAPEKCAALLSWSGRSSHRFSGQIWPTHLNRWIDVKLVYEPDAPVEVKGYLGFMPSFSLLE